MREQRCPRDSTNLSDLMTALILRLLYKLRSLSEQGPFDGPSFTFISSFLRCVVRDRDVIGSSDDEDEPLERMVLVIDTIKLHAAECKTCSAYSVFGLHISRLIPIVANRTYPRSSVLSMLVDIIKVYPSLGKDASSALVAVGEAMTINAERAEIEILVKNTLASESYVRNSVLQCMQVRQQGTSTLMIAEKSFRLWT